MPPMLSYHHKTYHPVWIREDFIDLALSYINPLWAWRSVKAKVIQLTQLPDDMVEITLRPNRHFKSFTAGQFVFVTVQIHGVNEQRAYSIVNAPSKHTDTIRLAVKVQGSVSGYLANKLSVGDVIDISQAQGEFVVNANDQARLFIAAGSGITPIISMLSYELERNHIPTQLIYISRDPIYADELHALDLEHPHFTMHLIQDSTEDPAYFGQAMLGELDIVPENQTTYLCGAPSLMTAVNALWQEKGISHLLKQERFVSPETDANAESFPVNFRQKQRTFEATGNLLTSAEQAGLNPASGCRMGICNTCACQKVAGTVRNQLTGETSNRPNEMIKLCISEALSPLEIDT